MLQGEERSEIRFGFGYGRRARRRQKRRVEGDEDFGAAVTFHAVAGCFGDFLAETHVVEAGFNIEDADALRVELAGPDGADFFHVSEVGLDFLEFVGDVPVNSRNFMMPNTNTPIHQYTNTPIHQYTNTPIHQYTNTPIRVHDKKVGLQAAAAQKSSKRPDI